ncbi:MAG TPA: NAD(P)/FAD-dependent oxidoreductase [Candidatus Acidoferrales bacterium]|nr:NAD(P)/FAD-dependent oxidoreductase [Candidatus Acidoferrales bacterium]
MKRFDLVVIGTGAAASSAASKCRAAGWEVAIVDSRPFGGTCALRGCDPKKVLVGAAEIMDWNNRMQGNGIVSKGVEIDWPALMRFKRTFTDLVPKNTEQRFAKAGIVSFHGRARFVGKNAVAVGDETLEARYVVVATGAWPAKLGIPGEELLTRSDEFLELETLPKRIIFVGGGYISFEFAHIAARAGAAVRILHRGPRPLVGFDPDLVNRLAEATRDIGIELRLSTAVEAIEKRSNEFVVRASRQGEKEQFHADLVVHGAGRVPEIEDLDLDKARVDHHRKGVVVNEYLQSVSNPAVYAAGDAAASGGLPLTPVASMEGRVAAANLLNGNHEKPNYAGVPTVVFTVPPLASVGLQEASAKEQGLNVRVNQGDTSGWYSSRRVGMKYSGYKVLVEEGSNRILGAHLLGPHAEEIINLFALAIRLGIAADELKEMRYSYPSHSDDISYMV